MRDIARNNLATLQEIEITLPLAERANQIVQSSRYRCLEINPKLIENMKLLIETLKGRDKYIQGLMQIIEEKFEKVWGIPWASVRVVHGYLWDREDLLNISSKVKAIFSLFS